MNKRIINPLLLILILTGLMVMPVLTAAQPFDQPLRLQGLDKTSIHSSASRALGGTSVGLNNQAGLMFTNPAALQTIEGIQISLGNSMQYNDASQIQQYGPAKYYPNFSLVMEGLTDRIPDTRLDTSTTHTARDSVQRPYDKIGPDWSRSKSRTLPVQAMLAVPFKVGGLKVVAGIGMAEYANMNSYYQNNNVLTPAINIQRPYPIKLVTVDSLSLPVQWYQTMRSREGSINGYGAALSVGVNDNLTLGLSGMIISGSTDDYEQTVGRGRFVFYGSYFRLDSVKYGSSKTGTSDYSGQEFTVSGMYKTKSVTFGFAVKPPSTITRKYNLSYFRDTLNAKSTASLSGEDNMQLPWRGMLGLSVSVWENLRAAVEYEIRPYSDAVYESNSGSTANPWKSASLLRAGIEYSPAAWLTLRGGVRDDAEIFEPAGNPFEGDPVTSSVISGGIGLKYMGANLNLTYEYHMLKYTDMLQDAVYKNQDKNQILSAEINYNIPWHF